MRKAEMRAAAAWFRDARRFGIITESIVTAIIGQEECWFYIFDIDDIIRLPGA